MHSVRHNPAADLRSYGDMLLGDVHVEGQSVPLFIASTAGSSSGSASEYVCIYCNQLCFKPQLIFTCAFIHSGD